MTPWGAVQAAQRMAAALDKQHHTHAFSNHVEEIRWSEGWADGREAPKGIAYADWNDPDYYDAKTKTRKAYEGGDIMSRLCAILEKMGVEIEWCDVVSECDACDLLVQTEPNSYSWTPDFWCSDNGITCAKCVKEDPEAYLEWLNGNADVCLTIEGIDLADHGYTKVNEDSFESGWHPGQTDDPRKVAKDLKAKGVEDFIFVKDEQSQLYSKWSVWAKIPLDAFTQAYAETALWASNDFDHNGGEPLDRHYSVEDIAPETLAEMVKDCAAFQAKAKLDVRFNLEEAGHNFWLTRNDHGVGFWDGDYPEPYATILTDLSKTFGTVDLYVGDDGKVYAT